jgi:hypothetical protein
MPERLYDSRHLGASSKRQPFLKELQLGGAFPSFGGKRRKKLIDFPIIGCKIPL